MATSRISTSSIKQGFPKSRSLLAGNAFYSPSIIVDYLVVAGGGGSKWGGGGAGAVIALTSQSLSVGTSYTVTIGAGGAVSNAGNNSVAFGNTRFGGGTANSDMSGITNNGNGGNGGGANAHGPGDYNGILPGGVGSQGYNGGSADNYAGGGGGGGAGGAGDNTTTNSGGNGGIGISNSFIGTATYYGGGGGGGYNGGSNGTGGLGGGGDGTNAGGNDGTANTGGGGGGAYTGKGGSGVIILRYPNTYPDLTSIAAGLTYTKTTPTGYKVYKFTAGTGLVTI